MILKEFKHEIIKYARTLIPKEYSKYFRIPGSAETNYLQIRTTKKKEVVDFIQKKYGQQNFNVQFSKNDQIQDLLEIESFEMPVENNLTEISELFPGRNEMDFLAEEKRKTAHNFNIVLKSPNTSIRKIIEHINIQKATEMPDITEKTERELIWEEFLKTWPLSRIKKMTLDEYTNLNKSDSFCYWLEKLTESLGSIWGGSSYKFGIYRRGNVDKDDARKGYKTDGVYAWVLKFGEEREEAFNQVRNSIFQVAELATKNDLTGIDSIQLGHAYKWKIAVLYNKKIPLIYAPAAINYLCQLKQINNDLPYSGKYLGLAEKNETKNILEYSDELWELYQNAITMKVEDDYKKPESVALNQILYGPPGTGKTYFTVNKALQIVDPSFYEENKTDRKKLTDRYKQLLITDWEKPKGQIAFCTFHQSFSYEDFVEGIKPITTEDKKVVYEIEDGIFKKICALSEENNKIQSLKVNRLITWNETEFKKAVFYKISLGNIHNPDDKVIYDYCIQNNCISIGFGGGLDFSGLSETQIQEKCKENSLQEFDSQALKYFIKYLKIGDYVIVSKGNRLVRAMAKVVGDYEFIADPEIPYNNFRKVEWLFVDEEIPADQIYKRNLSQMSIYKLDDKMINKEFFVEGPSAKADTEEIEEKKFVLIIDEINRGNVSSIFGELITLIEKDKRAGEKEELTITLPYSKDSFNVPRNIYLIGTMNTADRSIEALDTALRRRFTFVEKEPQHDLLAHHTLKILHNQFNEYDGIEWEDTEWQEVEDDFKNFFFNPELYDDFKEDFAEKLTFPDDPEEEIDYEAIASFFREKNIKYLEFDKLLNTINLRIEKLLDKDHKIGHSYFFAVNSYQDLEEAFRDKVIPLLEEYFYGDFGKIGLILGDSFVTALNGQGEEFDFANFKDYDHELVSDLKSRKVYAISPSSEWSFRSIYQKTKD